MYITLLERRCMANHKQTHFSSQLILTVYAVTMVQLYKVFLVVTSVQHICALHKSLLFEPKQYGGTYILSQIIQSCIAKVHSDNRQLVSIKFTAATNEQTRKQSDLIQMLLSSTKQSDVCYVFLDLNLFPNNLSRHRGFNLIFTDNTNIFR